MDACFESDLEDELPPAARAFPPGTRLGNDLTITGILGEGGTAIVYSAHHRVLEREVAVKVSVGDARESNSRLVREAKMCASVRDPHIPRVFGLDYLEDGTPFLIMEKVEGEMLTRILARWRLPVRSACEIACELLETLDAIHFAGLLHRDVKPSNVMIDANPAASVSLRLLDFGVGKILRTHEVDLPELTCKGELLGTPLYMAPEQVLTMPVDERADVYAAGVVLYEMLAGHTPFRGDSIGEVFAAVLRDEIKPLWEVRPELPASLCEVVHRALSRQRDDRHQTAYAMRVAVLGAMQDVLAMGPMPAFEAVDKNPEVGNCGNQATIQMPYEALTRESYQVDLESDHWFAMEDSERSSGERLKCTVSYFQTLARKVP